MQDSAGSTFILIGGGFSFGGGDVTAQTWTRQFISPAAGSGDFPVLPDADWTAGPDLPMPLSGAKAVQYAGGDTFLVVGSSDKDYDGERSVMHP